MPQLFEISVTGPRVRENYWHLADSADDIAELLADSLEAQRGYAIAIRPADFASLRRLVANNPQVAEYFDCDLAQLKDLIHHLLRASLLAWAVRPPIEKFHLILTEPKGRVDYVHTSGACLN